MIDRPHILIVDDDRRIRGLLKTYLAENGYRVSDAGHAAEARDRMRGVLYDLIILDVMMPGEDGLKFAKSFRSGGQDVPILMLSALAEADDRVAGLLSGSDDYLTKPFEPRELLLRIKNLLARRPPPSGSAPGDVRFGSFAFNLARGELRRDGHLVRLTTRERDLLRLLAKSDGAPVARALLAQRESGDSARSVDVQINRLRQKIEKDPSNPVYLQTVRGAGYALHLD